MATSEEWHALQAAKDDFYFYRRMVREADLAVDCYNPHIGNGVWTMLNDGSWHIPYCIAQNFSQTMQPAGVPGFDLRCHPYWRKAAQYFMPLYFEQSNRIRPDSMGLVAGNPVFTKDMDLLDPSKGFAWTDQAGNRYDFQGYDMLWRMTRACDLIGIDSHWTAQQWATRSTKDTVGFGVSQLGPTDNETLHPAWEIWGRQGLLWNPHFSTQAHNDGVGPVMPYSGDWTTTGTRVNRQREKGFEFYTQIMKNALYYWLILHDLSPGAYIDYRTDLEGILQQINASETGDPMAIAITEMGTTPGPTVSSASASDLSVGVTPYSPPEGEIIASARWDKIREYLPYAAAAGIVGIGLMSRKRKAGT